MSNIKKTVALILSFLLAFMFSSAVFAAESFYKGQMVVFEGGATYGSVGGSATYRDMSEVFITDTAYYYNGVNYYGICYIQGGTRICWVNENLLHGIYTVSYNANGGTGAPGSFTKYGKRASTLSRTIPSRSGYSFVNWNTNSSGTGTSFSAGGSFNLDGNYTLYAQWSPSIYTVYFNANGGSCSTSSKTVTYNSTYGTLPTPTRTGYTFNGWYTSSSGGTKITSSTTVSITSNQTLYAHWIAKTYTVSFDANGGSCSTSSKTVTYSSTYGTLPTPNRSGYTFSGWYTNSTGGTKITSSTTVAITSNQTLYAHWTAKTYTVSYDANGGSDAPTSHSGDVSYTIKSTIPTRSGYNFLGWSESSSATKATYHAGDTITPTRNTILYAVWFDSTNPVASISCTNNVSSSQTVTLSFSDNDGIAGYYWGTSATYSNNTYTATISTSATKTISVDGTYYLVVKDKNNNVSDNKSITFFKTSLNANGGSVSPSTVLTASGNSFTLPTPSYSDHTFNGWNTASSGSGTNYSGTYTPSSSRTLYAQWTSMLVENIYNLGDETYSFHNYGDTTCSQRGHCFGMAVTSSGYYTGNLDKSIIGGNNNSSLYSFADTPTVRKPICHYFKIQGSVGPEDSIGAEREAIVAGGTFDLTGRVNTQSDWTGCVNYVKSHNYDNKGNLNIGMYFYEGGGHQVNFLYYKEVSGQQRIYAYDNNSPEKEIYYYMGSDNFIHMGPTDYIISRYGYDYKIDCLDLMDVNIYYPLANSYRPYRYIYANKNEIIVEDATCSILKCGPETKDYVVYEIPMDTKEVTITPLVEGASFQYLNNDYSFGTVDEKTYGVLEIPSKNAIEGQSTGFTIKNAPVSIKNYTPTRTEAYKTTITFTADASSVPDGASIHWFINGKDEGTGNTYTVKQATSDYNIQVKVIDKDENVISESGVESVKINNGFFARLIAFFKQLFHRLPVKTQ